MTPHFLTIDTTENNTGGLDSGGRVVKALVKLTLLVCAIALMMPLAARAQVDANRVLSPPTVAPEAPKPGEKPPLFIVNDNTLGYRYSFTGTDPGSGKTPKNDLWFNHFDVWTYGTNFVSFDWLTATNGRVPPLGAPAGPCDQGYPTFTPGSQLCPGYTEIYALIRSTLGWNQIFNTKAFSIGPADQHRVYRRRGLQRRQYY